jgi:Skp family chaperone for outer membrane proteins
VKRTFTTLAGMIALGLGLFACAGEASAQAPTSRIKVVNIWMVVKNYKRTEALRAELQGIIKGYDDELKQTKTDLEGRKTQIKDADNNKYTDEQKKALVNEVKRLERILTDKGEEMREKLIKKESEQAIGVFHEIEDAIGRVAKSGGAELVLIYGDTPDEKDRNVAANLARKINTSACLPLYMAPGVDITTEVLTLLNAKYPAAAGGGTPPAPGGGN